MKKISVFLLTLILSSQSLFADMKPYEARTEEWARNSEKAEEWTFEKLPHHIGQDIKYSFVNPYHFLGITVAVPLIAVLQDKDPNIQNKFVTSRPLGKKFDDIMNISTHPAVLGGATLLALGISELAHWEKASVTAGTMLEALVLSEALTMGLKYSVRRGRPDGSGQDSFPSAHSTGTFALATVAEVYYGPLVGVPAYALATLSGLSRIDANKHFASDVAAGALIGTIIGLGTAKFHKKIFSKVFLLPEYNPDTEETGFKIISPF